jgi:2-keto-4-pentenoate hydratase/2-oxohepta-3-ene-1,7-dioic acid hydratase in catechol pathway
MKLCRYGAAGRELPGLIDRQGAVRDLSSVVRDLDAEQLTPAWLETLRRIDPDSLPLVAGAPRLGVPWSGIGKFIAIGLNYVDHAHESNLPIPTEPVVFMKPVSCIVGGNDDVMQPKGSTKLDWEVELGVVIGTAAQDVSEADALGHVAGYCLVNDVSERAFQLQSSQWDKGKGCDTFGPIGPWLLTADEVPDPQALDMWLDVNGSAMQRGNTRTMIFSVAQIVSYLSRYMTLYPGDVICTGTPPGVGMGKKPAPIFLQPGDVVTLGIEGLGTQRQQIVPWARTLGVGTAAR